MRPPTPSETPSESTPSPSSSADSGVQATIKSMTSSPSVTTILGAVFGVLMYLIHGIGAAKLSYDKYGSIFWAIPAFFFSAVYYPYYAFFVSTRVPMFGGRRR